MAHQPSDSGFSAVNFDEYIMGTMAASTPISTTQTGARIANIVLTHSLGKGSKCMFLDYPLKPEGTI